MRELTPDTITDAVLEQMATTPDPRMREVMASAVKHLHAFARDVNLTPGEWIKGIAFMTAVGKMCTAERQEFVLLSDTLGLSALVNGLHDKTAIEEGTHTSLLGPFYREASPTLAAGSQIARTVKPGSECVLYGRVTDVNGKPLAGRHRFDLADRRRRPLRYPGKRHRRRLSRRLHHRCGWRLRAAHRQTDRLLDPDGRPGRRDGPGAGAARHAAGAYPLPGRPAGLSRAGDGALPARRSASCGRRGVRLVR